MWRNLIVLQSGLGAFGFFVTIIVIILAFLAIGYLAVLPWHILKGLTKTWTSHMRKILVVVYLGNVVLEAIILSIIPFGWFAQVFVVITIPNYLFNNSYSTFLAMNGLFILLMPWTYIIAAGIINHRKEKHHSNVVNFEGCSDPPGCKVEEKTEKTE